MFDHLHELDQDITLWINSIHYWISDDIWVMFSSKTVWIPFYLILIAFIWLRMGWRKALVIYSAIILTILFGDQLSNMLKHAVGRLRPCYDMDMLGGGLRILESKGGYYGFYSSHASNAFGLAAASVIAFRNDKTHTYRTYAVCVYIWALLVATSRIFVGKHYFGDVLVGSFVGILFGTVISLAANYLIGKYIVKEKR